MTIVLAAYGKRGYGYAAHNLALSLRYHNYTDNIYLYARPETLDGIDHSLFDKIEHLTDDEINFRGKFAPGFAKINVLNKLPDDENLFIDADSLVLRNIYPLINELRKKDFSTIWMGEGGFCEDISYDPWALHEYAYFFFNLPVTQKWTTTQTSLVWMRRNAFTDKYVRALKYFYEKGYSMLGLKEAWAKEYLPDELFMSGVVAHFDLDIKIGMEPVFFGLKNNPDKKLEFHEIENKYYILSMLGGGGSKSITLPSYQDWYTNLGRNISRVTGKPFFTSKYIMVDKLLNA